MPELPEVEVVRRSLQSFIKGLKIKKVSIFNRNLRYKISKNFSKTIKNHKIISIERKSKFILIGLDNNKTILIHLGMTGKIFIINNYLKKIFKTSFYYENELSSKHNHLMIDLNKSTKLIYNDVRKFGFIKLIPTNRIGQNKHLILLGPEPLTQKFNEKYFKKKLSKIKKNLKNFLMDQKLVSGLGNIYVNEILHLSSINPLKISNKLKNHQIKKIIKNTKTILLCAIKLGGSSIRDFKGIEGQNGYFQQNFMVYNRDKEACKKEGCSGKIKKIYISNRSTFYCLKCQK